MSCYVNSRRALGCRGCQFPSRTPLMTYLSLPYALLAAVPLLCHVYTLPVYAHMILMTLITIFIGAHLSLPNADESIPTVRFFFLAFESFAVQSPLTLALFCAARAGGHVSQGCLDVSRHR